MTKEWGIPTLYNGQMFRSRLEARWAAFFDLAEWRWTYEPFDAAGYIPDFLIHGDAPLLIEVKPIWNHGLRDEIRRRLGGHESLENLGIGVLCLGADPIFHGESGYASWDMPVCGYMFGSSALEDDEAVWVCAESCLGVSPIGGGWLDHPHKRWSNGAVFSNSENGTDVKEFISRYWREAGNIVQWNPTTHTDIKDRAKNQAKKYWEIIGNGREPDVFKFVNVGDEIAGTIRAHEVIYDDDAATGVIFTLNVENRYERKVSCTQVVLKRLLAENRPDIGDWIHIRFTGTERSAYENDTKLFDLQVRRAERNSPA